MSASVPRTNPLYSSWFRSLSPLFTAPFPSYSVMPHPLPPLQRQSLRRRELLGAVAATCFMTADPAAANSVLLVTEPSSNAWPPAKVSKEAQQVVRWAQGTKDHGGLPFAVIDKPAAWTHVFSTQGEWMGSSPVLLGAAHGDRSAPDIGTRPLSRIRFEERTTPAGRFVTEPGRNLRGDNIVWIDYDAAVSLHAVRSVHAAERRHERLASPNASDRRISYGCVNAPESFYRQRIAPVFGRSPGIVYILPDTEPFASFFIAASTYY